MNIALLFISCFMRVSLAQCHGVKGQKALIGPLPRR